MNKFRVWNLKDEVFENNILLSSENELYKIKNNKLIKVKRENYVVQYSIDIKDENGIEIYEGDIDVYKRQQYHLLLKDLYKYALIRGL